VTAAEATASAAGVLLHAARLLPVSALSPVLGGPLAPPFVRVALAAGLGACAWGAAGAPPAPAGPSLALAAARELAVGAVLAFLTVLPYEAARAAGRLTDTLRGATLAELHVAPLRQRETALGDLLAHWTVVLAAAGGGARLVVAALLDSFRTLPAGAAPRPGAALGPVLHAASALVATAWCVAAPAAAGVLAADLAVALALRASPQLGLQAVAQPARAAAGLAAIAVSAAAAAGRLTALAALSAELTSAVGGSP
jgi:type III secretory pathway component EscT